MTELARHEVGGTTFLAIQGDLTAQPVDAVVNAANEKLAHGGGVARAIVRAGGRVIQRESDEWVRTHGRVANGSTAVTSAGDMPARWIVHTVGPRYQEGQDNAGMLRAAVSAALDAAVEAGARTIAFPAISAGIFGYPRDEATRIIADESSSWAASHPEALAEVRLVGFDEGSAGDFAAAIQGLDLS